MWLQEAEQRTHTHTQSLVTGSRTCILFCVLPCRVCSECGHTHTHSVCSQEAEHAFCSVSCPVICAQNLDTHTHTHSVCSQEAEHAFCSVSSSVVNAQDPDLAEPRFTVCKAGVTVPTPRSCCEALPKATQCPALRWPRTEARGETMPLG